MAIRDPFWLKDQVIQPQATMDVNLRRTWFRRWRVSLRRSPWRRSLWLGTFRNREYAKQFIEHFAPGWSKQP
jgi:hypothetical protein